MQHYCVHLRQVQLRQFKVTRLQRSVCTTSNRPSSSVESILPNLDAVEQNNLVNSIAKRASWSDPSKRPDIACRMFDLMKESQTNTLSISRLFTLMKTVGVQSTDPRLETLRNKINESHESFDHHSGLRVTNQSFEGIKLSKDEFVRCVADSEQLVARCIMNDLAIGDWPFLIDLTQRLYDSCQKNNKGEAVKSFSKLAPTKPNYWGVSLCSIDGQRHSVGDSSIPVGLQAAQFPFAYSLALNDTSEAYVHEYVGHEPSGLPYGTLDLNNSSLPHNPMLNSGAIAIASLIQNKSSVADRFDYVLKHYRRLTGNEFVNFNNAAFLANRAISHLNFALAYVLKEAKCFPEPFNLQDNMDLFFQLGSIEMTCESASVAAATLANGGICPITDERVLSSDAVRDTLSLMYSCGMYDYSGQFAFKVGLPAKSSMSGLILLVVPNLMGVALYSPRLDHFSNPTRGIQFCEEFVKHVNYHNYDSLIHLSNRRDLRHKEYVYRARDTYHMLFAAFQNDVNALRWVFMRGVDLNKSDYDNRTPLHVAAAEGHLEAVKFLLEHARVNPKPIDRWENTPLDEATLFGHEPVIQFINKYLEWLDLGTKMQTSV